MRAVPFGAGSCASSTVRGRVLLSSSRSSRVCACATRAARRHLLWPSHAAAPPITTPARATHSSNANSGTVMENAGCD